MPILDQEPACYPPELFDAGELPAGDGRQSLWVLHTKPRQEKALARQLHAQRVPFYLPLGRKRSDIRGRAFTSYLPLFTGYLFLLADQEERAAALSRNRVVACLPVPDQRRLWHDLHQVKRLAAAEVPLDPEEHPVPGTAVEICSGPLTGLKGKLLAVDNRRRFVVEVDFLQKGAAVTLDRGTDVRPTH